jgi:hypothetical protein
MTAVNSSMPNIPRLEMEKVLPVYSSGFSFFSRARPASSLTSAAISPIPLRVRVAHHRGDEPLLHRDRHADVHLLVEADRLARPRGVDPRVLAQRHGDALMIRSLGETLIPSSFSRSLRRPRSAHRLAHVHFHGEEEVRHRADGLREPPGDGLAHLESGTSRYSAWAVSAAAAGAGADRGAPGASAGFAAGPACTASSMSRLTMRPPGPLPRTPSSATPASAASRRASGEAFTRPSPCGSPPPHLPPAVSDRGAGAALLGGLLRRPVPRCLVRLRVPEPATAFSPGDVALRALLPVVRHLRGRFAGGRPSRPPPRVPDEAGDVLVLARDHGDHGADGRGVALADQSACAAPRRRGRPAPWSPCRSPPPRARRPRLTSSPSFFSQVTSRPSSIVGESASM